MKSYKNLSKFKKLNNFKKILITNHYYSQNPKQLSFFLYKVIRKKRPDFIVFRNKKAKNFLILAKQAFLISKCFGIKLIVNQNIQAYQKLKPFGIHLTSKQFNQLKKVKGYKIISTHSEKEIKKAKRVGANSVFYSPIFNTPNKSKPKGIKNLKTVTKNNRIKIFALGGITTSNQVKQIKKTKAAGFASIRYWYN